MESSKRNVIHSVAGGAGGTAGAVLTCPLEVVKTRLQSSNASTFARAYVQPDTLPLPWQVQVQVCTTCNANIPITSTVLHHHTRRKSASIIVCLKYILQTEGIRGLFKGIGPTIVGVAPSRAIYFGTYAKCKRSLNEKITPDTPLVHLCSAVAAGLSAATCTNPIWLVKTRLQLDQKTDGRLTCRECIRRIYQQGGLLGFYKGLTASYYGVSETVLHLVVYEAIKARLLQNSSFNQNGCVEVMETSDFFKFMLAGAMSKTFATSLAYPHEVARTRLREEGTKYQSFFQTLGLVVQEEGFRGLYRGLTTQLVRQIPNTAIIMATYEAVAYFLTKCFEEEIQS